MFFVVRKWGKEMPEGGQLFTTDVFGKQYLSFESNPCTSLSPLSSLVSINNKKKPEDRVLRKNYNYIK